MKNEFTFQRYEIKYLLTKPQAQKLKSLMQSYMIPDQFGKCTIRNIYLDTPDKLLIRRSLEKPCYKEKLRVRSYKIASENTTVYVELKKKYDGIVYKRRIDMSERTAFSYLTEHIALPVKTQISKEIDYFLSYYQNLSPSVFLSYDREAYYAKADSSFRMTLDDSILTRDFDMSLQKGIYGRNILPGGNILLEVKTSLGIPQWLLSFLSANKIYKTSFSKYGTAYQQMLLPRYIGGLNHVA